MADFIIECDIPMCSPILPLHAQFFIVINPTSFTRLVFYFCSGSDRSDDLCLLDSQAVVQ